MPRKYCLTCGRRIRPGGLFCAEHMKLARWQERVERQCLKCNEPFLATGRFNRTCPGCAATNDKVHDLGARYEVIR